MINQSVMVEYINKALDMKIKKVGEFVAWQQRIIDDAKARLKKEGEPIHVGGGLYADMEAPNDFWAEQLKKATEKRDGSQKHLDNYKRAKAEFRDMVKTWESIKQDFQDTEEGLDAGALDDAINDCLEAMGEFEKGVLRREN